MNISLCIITKNNQETLANCINSVREIADEIVVVDTGSEDDTMEIAEGLGAKVFSYEWKDNFSDAKNFALDKATKEWILALDADETIAKKDLKKIKKFAEQTDFFGFAFIQRNYHNTIGLFSSVSCKDDEYEESKGASCFAPRRIVRMFKNDRRIRFEGAVHDTVEPSIFKIGKILDTEIPIHHFGMLGRASDRTKKYIEIEKKNLRNDFFQDYQIGIQLHEIGEIVEAVKFLKQSIALNPNFCLSWLELGIILIELGRVSDAKVVLEQAEKLGTHEMIFSHLGVVYGVMKQFSLSV